MLTGLTAQGASTRQPAPLFAVNIASHYAPGVAVMKTFGYTVPWRSTMLVTAGVSAAAAPLGGHAVNLAAISAALSASPPSDATWRCGGGQPTVSRE